MILNYELKIENSPINIGTGLKDLKVKSMKLSIQKTNDFNISFKHSSTSKMLYDWIKLVSENMNKNTIFDTLELRVLTKPYPYKSKKKRLVKKWWDKYSEIRIYRNVKLKSIDY